MTFSSCITSQDKAIVLDASVVINLLATGHATEILKAIPIESFVTNNVVREINQGAANGRHEFKGLSKLTSEGVVQVVDLDETSLQHFFGLVSGSTVDTLGDGEAATIAVAAGGGYCAGIDERKATRIAIERFGSLKLATTVDILCCQQVQVSLGRSALANATLQALKLARMQVKNHQLSWIVELIGEQSLQSCPSLRKHKQLYKDRRINHRNV